MKLFVNFERSKKRVMRSGHWVDHDGDERRLWRFESNPNDTDGVTGFRGYRGVR